MRHFTYKSLPELASDADRIGARHVLLEPDPENPKWIKTVHGVGYRLEMQGTTNLQNHDNREQ